MMFTELFVPKGAHTHDELDQLAHRLTAHALYDGPAALSESGERADPGVLDFLETITNVVVHETDVWVVGGRRLGATGPPRYLVRVWVPGPWRKPISEYLITHITHALTEPNTDDPPQVEVHVLGVPEGSYGAFGRVIGDDELTDMISEAVTGMADVPDGMTVDPVCGCTVSLRDPAVITADADGTTYGFCSTGCRRTFLARTSRGD